MDHERPQRPRKIETKGFTAALYWRAGPSVLCGCDLELAPDRIVLEPSDRQNPA